MNRPTPEMWNAFEQASGVRLAFISFEKGIAAMLAAAPTPPAQDNPWQQAVLNECLGKLTTKVPHTEGLMEMAILRVSPQCVASLPANTERKCRMNKIDWREVIVKIKRERKWPRKTIAAKVGACEGALRDWQSGKCEPRYSQGAELLRLAGMEG